MVLGDKGMLSCACLNSFNFQNQCLLDDRGGQGKDHYEICFATLHYIFFV